MAPKTPGNETKTVTHVYAHCVTHVYAPCREGVRFMKSRTRLPQRGRVFQPRVARNELPWEYESKDSSTPTGLHQIVSRRMQPFHWSLDSASVRGAGSF